MKYILTFISLIGAWLSVNAQIDPELLRSSQAIDSGEMNMDAIYNRPFIKLNKVPVALGGYVEGNYQYLGEDGVTEGHQFQFRRLTLFISASIGQRMKFLTEIEFEEGGKEINIEFASLDFEIAPLLNFRGGIVMNPIGAFNQNHDGSKWEFVDRPISATQMLPATFSNAGFGVFGKKFRDQWSFGYEVYLTNGFDESIVENSENKTFLPATKQNPERFEESFNGSMLFSGKTALRNERIGELGLSYMSGAYNKFQEDGLELDHKRKVSVYALDFNTNIGDGATITTEFAWVSIDIPDSYTEQFGRMQRGGFIDIVQPISKRPWLGFSNSIFNIAARAEYVDWNRGTFKSTGGEIADHLYALAGGVSWRPTSTTVFRFNYRYKWQKDLLGNPYSKQAGIQVGFSTYF